jgi:hypothetical protein
MLNLLLASALAAASPAPVAKDALLGQQLGLVPGAEYRLTTGRCADCPAPRQALWYFENDLVAVPRKGSGDRSSLVWIGSPEVVADARLSSDGRSLATADGQLVPFAVAPKIATNRSYYDAHTTAFFAARPLRLRGHLDGGAFTARSIWPEDLRLEPDAALRGLSGAESISSLVTADDGGAQAPPQTRVLWRRAGSAEDLAGHAALAFVLSGAQGDDDEAHGGHFAIATGRVGPHGEWHDWLVNNFYNLDSVSEKGILASRLPMDHYLMDVNSGQSYYRPVYVLALVLRDGRVAQQYQHAIDPIYDRLYRHDLVYHHSAANCAGISMDALRGLGWNVPRRGPTGYLKATAAFFYVWAKDHDESKGESTFDYLTEEQTRLLPRAAFEEAGRDALRMLSGDPGRTLTDYERLINEDTDAVVFMRVPQIPSSRPFGTYPIGSFAEYQARVPSDTSKWKIIPVDARPFPDTLREGPAPAPHRSMAPLFGALTAGVMGSSGLAGVRFVRRRRRG